MIIDKLNNYQKAYGNKIGFGKRPALILVDFVQAYFDESCELYANPGEALASALRIRKLADEKGIPVIFTNVVYHQGGADGVSFIKRLNHYDIFRQVASWVNGPKGFNQMKMN